MSKTDIFGKKPRREIQLKSAGVDLTHHAVLAIRINADILSFLKMIYDETNYLFYICSDRNQSINDNLFSEFQSFIYNDKLLDQNIFFLQNTSFDSNKRILGYDDTALFQIKRPQQKRKNQISFLFREKEADFVNFTPKNYDSEEQDWCNFKADLAQKSVGIMGKIDYVFPIQKESYEIVKSLLQGLSKIQKLNYMLLEPAQISDAMSFFTYVDLMTGRINPTRLDMLSPQIEETQQ